MSDVNLFDRIWGVYVLAKSVFYSTVMNVPIQSLPIGDWKERNELTSPTRRKEGKYKN